MLKLIMCTRRLPTLSREEFDHHWRNAHAALVRKHAAVLGIRRYIQSVPLDNGQAQQRLQAGRGAAAVDFDGCAELWWDDLPAHLAARKTPQGRQALDELIEDERRFVDLRHSQLWYCAERVVL